MADNMLEQTRKKALDDKRCEQINQRLADDWDAIREPLLKCMLPYETLRTAMQGAGCQLTATDLGLDTDFYQQAVKGARFIRDRYSMLDLVDDSTGLDDFVQRMAL